MLSEKSSNIDWMHSILRKPVYFWNVASNITVASVGILSKVMIGWLNHTNCYNKALFNKILEERPQNTPLITVSNHYSCVDDPGIWGCLNWRQLCTAYKMRWSLAAHDICFTNKIHSYFFLWGKCIPVVRGKGVYQDAVDFCVDRLQKGDWVHIFPEGRVNMTKEFIRLKWGVGRMVYESPVIPIVIPIWHIGMEEVLPNERPYIPNIRKRLTFNFGYPIDFSNTLRDLRKANVSSEKARQIITDIIQFELFKLRKETERLHST